jgi:hypothetical protein
MKKDMTVMALSLHKMVLLQGECWRHLFVLEIDIYTLPLKTLPNNHDACKK